VAASSGSTAVSMCERCVKRQWLQVVLYCFDCLYLDGEVLMRRPLVERRKAMYEAIVPQEGKIQFATAKISRDLEELQVRSGLRM
jgi:ATP-dependent DNA ligase